MKISLIRPFCLLAIGIAPALQGRAQTNQQKLPETSTNVYFLSSYDIRDQTWQEYEYYINALQHGVVVPEELPASQDTNDLWGPITNGFQLSIRFRKREYGRGDVVPAISILRNLEAFSKTVLLTNSRSLYLTFSVRHGTNDVAEREEPRQYPTIVYKEGFSILGTPHGFTTWKWNPRSEKELVLDLNGIFDLSRPGEYSVKSVCWVYSPSTRLPIHKISSGVASFRIVQRPATASK
jgi:hypothetical protein